ncbi:MAG: hypothetical protein ABJA66_00675 [Actinomycetota bacterium]
MANSLDYDCFGFKTFSFWRVSFIFYLLPFAFCLLLSAAIKAQDEEPPNAAPPPVKVITKAEKTALDSESDVKYHTRLAVDLMEAHLKKAEELAAQEAYNGMFTELGGFHALMDDTIRFLNKNNVDSGRVLDNFKRFEMALRSFTPRIELIRRELPEKFEFYVRKLLKIVRDTRAKAIEPMFSDKIVPTAGN